MGLFDKLKEGLRKTTRLLNTDIRDLFKGTGRLIDDGARIAVPRLGEAPPALDPSAMTGGADPGAAPTGSDGSAPGGPIDVNSASADELETLPGIGPTLAAAIIDERERNGPYESVDDLNRVPGIGDGRLSQIRDLVTV